MLGQGLSRSELAGTVVRALGCILSLGVCLLDVWVSGICIGLYHECVKCQRGCFWSRRVTNRELPHKEELGL